MLVEYTESDLDRKYITVYPSHRFYTAVKYGYSKKGF
jgi:hypothetical protein